MLLALRERPESERLYLLLKLGDPGLVSLDNFLHLHDGLLGCSLCLCLFQALLEQLYALQRFLQGGPLLVGLETITALDQRFW